MMSDAQRSYLFSGPSLLHDEALDQLRSTLDVDAMSETLLDPSAQPADFANAVGTASLFGPLRLVVVRHADDLTKEQGEALIPHIEAPSTDAVLVLLAEGRTKLDAVVKKHGSVVALEAPRGRRLAGWVRERGRRYGLRVDDSGAWALLDSVGDGLRDLDNALRQLQNLSASDHDVRADDVRVAFPRLSDQRIYSLTDAVGDRRADQAIPALRRLLDQGEEPLVLLGALAGHVRRMLVARRYTRSGPQSVADALGLPRWRAERLYKQANHYRDEELAGAIGLLAEADLELKSGAGDEAAKAALETAVIRIVAA